MRIDDMPLKGKQQKHGMAGRRRLEKGRKNVSNF